MAEQQTTPMPKFYPNDLCPCHSGKKYKHCCQKQEKRSRYLWDNFHAIYLDPQYTADTLAQTAPGMTAFFNERVSLLKKPLFFCLNPDSDRVVRSYDLTEAYLLVFKELPVPSDYTMETAHEIERLVYMEAGFPKAVIREGESANTYLATSLNHMLSAPLIDSHIEPYGFDFVNMLVHELQVQLPMLQNYPSEKHISSYDRYLIGSLLIQQLLKWHLMDDSYTCPYIPVYEMKFPTILEESKKRFQYILDYGYDTPEKTDHLLRHFIEINHLEDVLDVQTIS